MIVQWLWYRADLLVVIWFSMALCALALAAWAGLVWRWADWRARRRGIEPRHVRALDAAAEIQRLTRERDELRQRAEQLEFITGTDF